MFQDVWVERATNVAPLGTLTVWAALLSLSYALRDGVRRGWQSRVGKGGMCSCLLSAYFEFI